MRILVLGAGALGGYFGGRLLAAGRDVTFLVRDETLMALSLDGLEIRSAYGDLSLPNPPAINAYGLAHWEPVQPPYDLILLTCKSWDLPDAITAITPAVGPGTFILPLLNGMAHLGLLDQSFGAARVLGGLSNISAVRATGGRIEHLNRLHTLYFGARAPGPDLSTVAEALHDADFDDDLRVDIVQDMWDKWVTIATGAGATCLLRGAIGDIVAAGALPVLDAITQEAAAIAGAEGYPTSAAMRQDIHAKFSKPGSKFTASMLRDLEAGSRIERQQVFGELLTLARRHEIATPLLDLVNAHLSTYEARRMREKETG